MRPKTQTTGRMGELVVELELLKRGWSVINFNTAASNFIGWDLFATKETRSVKIRVKAKRHGEIMFRWGAKSDDAILPNLNPKDPDDFVAAVSFDGSPKGYQIHLIPSQIVEKNLKDDHREWVSGRKKNGGVRKNTTNRIVYMNGKIEILSHGYQKKWAKYLEAWDSLEAILD